MMETVYGVKLCLAHKSLNGLRGFERDVRTFKIKEWQRLLSAA
jgi:hypothetical protein